eukprot:Skav229558  [mRNA]  locus=scaffold568:410830:412038:+ [translate_table: standard]
MLRYTQIWHTTPPRVQVAAYEERLPKDGGDVAKVYQRSGNDGWECLQRIIIEIGALTDPDRDDYTRFLPTDPWASLPDGAAWW